MLSPLHRHMLTLPGYLTALSRTQNPSDVECDSISRLPHDCHTWLTNAAYHHETAQDVMRHWSAMCGSQDRKSTRLNSSHQIISYAVFCLKKKKKSNTKSVLSTPRSSNSSRSFSRPQI